MLPPPESGTPCPPKRSPDPFPISIRPAQLKDLTDLADVLTDSFHPPAGILNWFAPVLRLGIYEDLRNRLRSAAPHYACLVAVKQGFDRPGEGDYVLGTVEVGLRTLYPWQPRSAQYPYLSNLAVRQECRRQGVAHRLLLSCERVVLDWGFRDIYLHVLENNQTARRLYSRAGYRLKQVDPDWGCWLLGQPRRLFLHKHLDP